MEERFNVWMPLAKDYSGDFVGILSDDSIDRDGEFMTEDLLKSWAEDSKPLPMLANHENKIEKLIGGWHQKSLVSNGKNSALMAKPFFLKSNPLGRQTEEMVNEALEKGLEIGISIGAIPKETIEKEIDGKNHRGYKRAEIVEATIVPIQSNRNASFRSIAKSFDIELTKPKQVEDCVKALTSDPDFKPQGGKTKEESAWAVCQAKFNKNLEEIDKMTEETEVQDVSDEESVEVSQEEIAEEVKEDQPVEEQTPQEVVDETKEALIELQKNNEVLKKELEDLKKTAINGPTFEKAQEVVDNDEPLTIEKMLELTKRGQ